MSNGFKRRLVIACGGSAAIAHALPDTGSRNIVTVRPDPLKRHQVLEGWGVSLCWWAHMIGQWEDEAKIDEAIELLTSPDQLNMNIFRYNIGGGDDPSHYSKPGKPGHMARGKGVRAEMEGFKADENSPYDFAKDAGQRKVLKKILSRRPDSILEAFSNSPPYWMTHSGCSGGNHDAGEDNLKPEYYETFCEYLIDVCLHYKSAHGIEFRTLEPFNEPQTNYWRFLGGQEGCHFDIESQIELLRILEPKLKATALNTMIAASDETNVASGIRALKAYLSEGDIIKRLGQLNVHTYRVTPEQRKEMTVLVRKAGVRFWQSESGPMGGVQRKDAYATNLAMAGRMFDDLKDMQPVGWLDWQFMEEGNSTWCFIQGRFEEEKYTPVKNLYVRMQVTRFIKQGFQFIESGDSRVLAAMDPSGKEVVLVFLNEKEYGKTYHIDLNAIGHPASGAKAYRTSRDENCVLIKPKGMTLKNGQVRYSAPPESVTTLVIPI